MRQGLGLLQGRLAPAGVAKCGILASGPKQAAYPLTRKMPVNRRSTHRRREPDTKNQVGYKSTRPSGLVRVLRDTDRHRKECRESWR